MLDLIFVSGSSQIGSINWQLAPVAAALTRREFNSEATATVIYLSDFDLPNYSENDKGTSKPPEAVELRNRISRADGIFMSSDEYTGTYSALLKNGLKWWSALDPKNEALLRGMPIALCGASSRGVGALRGQPALARLLTELGAGVISQHLERGTAPGLFDEQGHLRQKFERQLIDGCLIKLIKAGKNATSRAQRRTAK